MEFPLPLPIRPVVTVATIEIRRAPNLILRDVGPEATKAGVVVQLVPRKGILLAAKAQEAAEGEEERGLRADCAGHYVWSFGKGRVLWQTKLMKTDARSHGGRSCLRRSA